MEPSRHKLTHLISRLVLLNLLVTNLLACQSPPVGFIEPDWKVADLRALDPAEDIPPSQDLIALYLRKAGKDLAIRLDFLDLSTPVDFDLTLVIDSPSISQTFILHILSSGSILARTGSGLTITGLQPRITRDTFLDTMLISLNVNNLSLKGVPFTIQVSTSPAGISGITDQIGPIRSDCPNPGRVEVLPIFWNTFQAYTPSQALRAWNGAHNGPGRSRHGLGNLLSAANANDIGVFLLDLKTPPILSALDYMGHLTQIKDLVDTGTVILPDTHPYDLPDGNLAPKATSNAFSISNSPFLYTAVFPAQVDQTHRVIFIPMESIALPEGTITENNLTTPFRWQNKTIVPLPIGSERYGENSPTSDGPNLTLRKNLIQAALDPQAKILILGGEFMHTAWGDPASILPTLRYLKAHPWVRFLTEDDLLTLQPETPVMPQSRQGENMIPETSRILAILRDSPPGRITDLAWETYSSLLTIPASAELIELRSEYFGMIGNLLEASGWAENPISITECSRDTDWDGQAECIFATQTFFSIIEPGEANVIVAFSRDLNGVHQIIAPYSQFVVGLGDPSSWVLNHGTHADPSLVQGGFIDPVQYSAPVLSPGQLLFTSEGQDITKTYQMTANGMRVSYQSSVPLTVQVSFGLDPWRRFSADWGNLYHEELLANSWSWSVDSGVSVNLSTDAQLTTNIFSASHETMNNPEDPNYDYPRGHFLPFPLALVEVSGQQKFYIDLIWTH